MSRLVLTTHGSFGRMSRTHRTRQSSAGTSISKASSVMATSCCCQKSYTAIRQPVDGDDTQALRLTGFGPVAGRTGLSKHSTFH